MLHERLIFEGWESVIFDSLADVLAEWSHLSELWWVVVIKRVDCDSVLELVNIARSLRAQVVDFIMVLKLQSLNLNFLCA